MFQTITPLLRSACLFCIGSETLPIALARWIGRFCRWRVIHYLPVLSAVRAKPSDETFEIMAAIIITFHGNRILSKNEILAGCVLLTSAVCLQSTYKTKVRAGIYVSCTASPLAKSTTFRIVRVWYGGFAGFRLRTLLIRVLQPLLSDSPEHYQD